MVLLRNTNKLVVGVLLDSNLIVLFSKKQFETSGNSYRIRKDNVKITNGEAVVENGIFTAKQAGTYTVKVSATWSNYVGEGLVVLFTMNIQ